MPLETLPASTSLPASPAISTGKALAALTAQGVLFTLAGLGLWHWSGRELESFVSFSLAEAAMGVGFGAALIAVAAMLFHAFPRVSEHLIRLQSDTYRFLGPNLGWPAVIVISLVAGISEEAALRGGLQTLLGDHVGEIAAIGVASALFAGLHLAKPLITGLLFIIGILFGVVYWQTGSLLTVMIGHVLYDVWALRYLNREMHRLNLFEIAESDPAPVLANAADPG